MEDKEVKVSIVLPTNGFERNKPLIGLVDMTMKAVRATVLMFELYYASGAGSGTIKKLMYAGRGITNGMLIVSDFKKYHKIIDSEKKYSGSEISIANYSIFYRTTKISRDVADFVNLFIVNKTLETISKSLEGAAAALSFLWALMVVASYAKSKENKEISDKLDVAAAGGDLASCISDLSFLPNIKALKWISYSTTAISALLLIINNIHILHQRAKKVALEQKSDIQDSTTEVTLLEILKHYYIGSLAELDKEN
ncbi:MAG: hypothetical protein JSR80_05800 [Verrucomicrobia bacterium]|nr:hypothetical protein [Verrucomicrobiota bacterium]